MNYCTGHLPVIDGFEVPFFFHYECGFRFVLCNFSDL